MTLPVLLTEHFLGSINQCVGCERGVTPTVSVAVPNTHSSIPVSPSVTHITIMHLLLLTPPLSQKFLRC
jgi:hypothetical protein